MLIFAALVFFFVAYVVYYYYTSSIGKKEKNEKKPEKQVAQKQEEKCDRKRDVPKLKNIIKDAIYYIKSNIQFIRSDNPLQYRPPILLTRYPFYIPILKVPKFLENYPCITKEDITAVLKDLYGKNLEQSPQLHANVGYNEYYFVLLDLNEAIEYYNAYKLEGIDMLI
jgi:uncharacterized protein (DUF433 family)